MSERASAGRGLASESVSLRVRDVPTEISEEVR